MRKTGNVALLLQICGQVLQSCFGFWIVLGTCGNSTNGCDRLEDASEATQEDALATLRRIKYVAMVKYWCHAVLIVESSTRFE